MHGAWKSAVLTLAITAATSVFAYEYALSVETIREVYFRPDDFWRDFKIELIQGTERIRASRATAHRLLGPAGDVNQPARWIGAEVELYYPATEVRPEPAQV